MKEEAFETLLMAHCQLQRQRPPESAFLDLDSPQVDRRDPSTIY